MRSPTSRLIIAALIPIVLVSGCANVDRSKQVIFLDGAGHFGVCSRVRGGLRSAGYDGEVHGFVWTSFLLWGADHMLAARSGHNARKLASTIESIRREHPDGYLAVAGLSAGCAVIANALERLPDGVNVDSVVMFQPSISATHNLSAALEHVSHRLYATCSRRDTLLAGLLVNADGESGPPAGRTGFRIPLGLSQSQRSQYRKVVNLPWQTKYRKLGWRGGHVDSTARRFLKEVIAPRILPAPGEVQETTSEDQKAESDEQEVTSEERRVKSEESDEHDQGTPETEPRP